MAVRNGLFDARRTGCQNFLSYSITRLSNNSFCMPFPSKDLYSFPTWSHIFSGSKMVTACGHNFLRMRLCSSLLSTRGQRNNKSFTEFRMISGAIRLGWPPSPAKKIPLKGLWAVTRTLFFHRPPRERERKLGSIA